MVTAAHAFVLVSLLLAPKPDTSALQFLGFRAGAALDELRVHLGTLGGTALRCRSAKTDRRVTECRAVVRDSSLGGQVDLWVSAIDSLAGVITLSGPVTPLQLEHWRTLLQERYGLVGVRVQGTQRMLQWVRRGRMIRLTWREESGLQVASVSLVDGRVLDDWGRARAPGPGS
jgi:hypothetical protein